MKDHEGLPANAPPWGTLNSIDLASGKIVWSFPLGNFLSHPDLGYGAINYGGPVVTASGLIFIGATPDKKFRAVDSEDGRILWETELSAAAFSTPAIYSVEGRQFVVISLEEADWVLLLVRIILRSRFQKRVKVKSLLEVVALWKIRLGSFKDRF